MSVKIRYFAWVREKTGKAEEVLDLPGNVRTVAELVTWLKGLGPEYAEAFARADVIRAAIDRTHVKPTASLAGDPVPSSFWSPPGDVAPSGVGFIYLHGGGYAAFDKGGPTETWFRHLAAQGQPSLLTAVGDTSRLTTRLLGRKRELTMTVTAFEPNRLVTYTSTQPGLPDARHERHFEPHGDGFVYRLVVEYEQRGGVAGLFDRLLLDRGIRHAFQSTFAALEREFEVSAHGL